MEAPSQFRSRDLINHVMIGVLTLLFLGYIAWLIKPARGVAGIGALSSQSPFLIVPLLFVVAFMVGSIFPSGAGILHPNALDVDKGVNQFGHLMRITRVLKPDKDHVRETLFDRSLTSQQLRNRVCRLAGIALADLDANSTSQQLHDLFELCRFHVMSLPSSSAQMDIERHFVLMYFNVKIAMLFFVTSAVAISLAGINSIIAVNAGVPRTQYLWLVLGVPVPLYYSISSLFGKLLNKRHATLRTLRVILIAALALSTIALAEFQSSKLPTVLIVEFQFLWIAQVCYVLSRVSGRRAQGNYRRWHRLVFNAVMVSCSAPFISE